MCLTNNSLWLLKDFCSYNNIQSSTVCKPLPTSGRRHLLCTSAYWNRLSSCLGISEAWTPSPITWNRNVTTGKCTVTKQSYAKTFIYTVIQSSSWRTNTKWKQQMTNKSDPTVMTNFSPSKVQDTGNESNSVSFPDAVRKIFRQSKNITAFHFSYQL